VKQYQYSMQEEGQWTIVDISGYPFKDFYHFVDQFNWFIAHYGSPTHSQKRLQIFGGNLAFISIIDGIDRLNDDPIYCFGFLYRPDAVEFYLSFV
jgi:hypothetical protein